MFEYKKDIFDFLERLEKRGEEFSYVSTYTPLISNLNMVENISLIEEVRYKEDPQKAQERALEILKFLELDQIAFKRPAFCSSYEVFSVQFVRASMVKEGKIAIITPSEFLLEVSAIDLIKYLQDRLKVKHKIIIFDLVNYKFKYENRGLKCHIKR